MERAIRPWLTPDWVFKLSALGRENQRCVEALHDFTNKVGSIKSNYQQQSIYKYLDINMFYRLFEIVD